MLKFLCQQVYQGRGGYLWITDAPFYDGAGCLTGVLIVFGILPQVKDWKMI